MINVFDLSATMSGTKMLTEKSHRDGSPGRRGRSDTTKKAADPPVGAHTRIEDKQVTHESRGLSRRKASTSGTPMKKLIEQEMSKEMGAQKNPPSIVAKLMGLDALPDQLSAAPVERRNISEGKTAYRGVTSASRDHNQQLESNKNAYGGRNTPNTSAAVGSFRSQLNEHGGYRDVYEVPPRAYRVEDESSVMMMRGRRCNPNERRMGGQRSNSSPSVTRMDLVREKFSEAKRLATNHDLLHSKEFQDAIEVLSSNRDLFLKFLEEPNSLFSDYFHELQRAAAGPLPPQMQQTRRITVLKPSNQPDTAATAVVDEKSKGYSLSTVIGGDKQEGRGEAPSRLNPGCNHPRGNNRTLPQPTRIVVLKPSPAKSLLNGKLPASSPPSSPTHVDGMPFGELLGRKNRYPKGHVAGKETAQHLRDRHWQRRDETLLSSVLSNGYTGDESSLNEYMEDDDDDEFSSDSETPSPMTRHSWDCNSNNNNHNHHHRFDSPCSLSSFSRASYSPESSVIREAKKRLSERWVMVTSSNELGSEHKQVRRSVSTLGEMLAIRGANKEVGAMDAGVPSRTCRSYGGEQELNTAASISLLAEKKDDDDMEGGGGDASSFPTLQRSKSVPASSSPLSCAYENMSRESDGTESVASKSPSKDKARNGKSSFKVKVSSFFSRNKRASSAASGQHKHGPGSQSSNGDCSGKSSPQLSSCNLNECLDHTPPGSASSTPCPSFSHDAQLFGPSAEASLVVKTPEKASETSGEPSPDSVLEAPFKDDADGNHPSSSRFQQGVAAAAADVGSSRLISRSSPIESIARTLPCDGGSTPIPSRPEKAGINVTTPRSSRRHHSLTSFLKADSEEHERGVFVQKLLSAAGLGDEAAGTVLGRWWHSLDSPLDPSLLEQFLERKGEEAQCRVRRSNQRLLFDSVNGALLEIGWTRAIKGVRSWSAQWPRVVVGLAAAPCGGCSVTKAVLDRLNEWCWGEEGGGGWAPPPSELQQQHDTSLVVDRIVRREVCGGGWLEAGAMEVLELCSEMEEQVLQGLVEEALVDVLAFAGQVQ